MKSPSGTAMRQAKVKPTNTRRVLAHICPARFVPANFIWLRSYNFSATARGLAKESPNTCQAATLSQNRKKPQRETAYKKQMLVMKW
ncbi:MAG: hypothetical protein LBS77_00205 [Desulfovibrio sp.]|jgi:hypothetical protein|nr:hypothetical protein [Desulfovibrio sp.]